MDLFNTSTITNNKDIIAQQLKKTRLEKKKSLDEVVASLGIRKEYLEALENGEYSKLPQGVYGKNYLREYGRYLKLDETKLLDMYDDAFKVEVKTRGRQVFSRKIPKAYLFLIIPRIIKNILLLLVVFICLFYLAYYVNNLIAPPKLDIYYPQEDIAVHQNVIIISGKTELEAEVLINNEKVLADKSGEFVKEVSLRDGVNTISIVSKKKYSKKSLKEIKVLVEN